MIDGVINLYKERGYTSHDAVARLRGILRQKKIGHTGTLDPDAEGVLPVCLGKATRLCDMLTDKEKTYRATLLLGRTTDTQDVWGETLEERAVNAGPEEVREAVMSFVGAYDQIPPMYSALKVNGKKLYELARAGKEVERKPRPVTIHEIEIETMQLPRVVMKVRCSKGTYIRTLCHDIGEKLGCGGCMESLLRTQVDRFLVEDSLTLGQIETLVREGSLERYVLSVEDMFDHCRKAETHPQADRLVHNGNPLGREEAVFETGALPSPHEIFRVCDSKGRFMGIYRWEQDRQRLKPWKMFHEQ